MYLERKKIADELGRKLLWTSDSNCLSSNYLSSM
jgi:hypothetical protein